MHRLMSLDADFRSLPVSKNTILALAPFLVASPASAAPRGTIQERRELALVSRNPALVALEAFGLAVDLINGITEMADGGGSADGDESAPRSLGQIDDRGTQAVCISGEKQVNPVWFRTTFREMCKKVVDYGDKKPTTGKYENMASVIEKHTAAWGQEIEFEIAWYVRDDLQKLC